MKNQVFKSFVELTGHPFSSMLLRKFTTSVVSKPLIKPFASFYHIQTDEAEYQMTEYNSLNDYFTRSLKTNSRPIDPDPTILISPVDGVLSCAGVVNDTQEFLVKDKTYSLSALLGDSSKAVPYQNGYYYVFYLSPRHYHHFHYPISGELISRYALGTTSYPVNDLGIRLKKDLFSTNYRLISEIQSAFGKVAVVKVGALNVNSIQLADSSKDCIKGDDFGHFAFGSTVILFIENKHTLTPLHQAFTEVKVGDRIGVWQS
ncbi:phosphatidylserine decarboxylase [Sporosarcina sp. PTS2304]|uniref:archaetidylserine decarboxylase n=1 Tax=Sporosarcina sp. PTS2304 TaxID=2283194 RepID=UPI000E0DB7BC|nr:archaetidylserine decarboxylase [Sporosarcina sp. PTS2304]AXH99404.1 phosphatidylserine decarboxylase [Sporosarcina sp. PTS2304]